MGRGTRKYKVCPAADCPELVGPGEQCPRHPREAFGGASGRRGVRHHVEVYSSPRWRALRRQVRREQPFCLCGCNTVWTELDHVVAINDGGEPFSRENVEGRCRKSHAAKTSREITARRTDRG